MSAQEALVSSCARPDQQIQEHGCQVNSLLRQPIIRPASIRLLDLGGENPLGFKFPQALRQDIRRNSLARLLKLSKCPNPRTIMSRMISSDQRSPSISKEMLTDTRTGDFCECSLAILMFIKMACRMQVIFCDGASRCRSPHWFQLVVDKDDAAFSGGLVFRASLELLAFV